MIKILDRIRNYGLIPVIKIEDAEKTQALGKSLTDGDLPIAEITYRSPAAGQALKKIKKEHPHMLIGAGTIITKEQADDAHTHGAEFLVTPGFNPKLVDYCLEKGYNIIPGINTPGEVEQAIQRGLNVLKFFPAEASGGVKFLKALSGPYPHVSFIPTGGVSKENIVSYLELDSVIACGGSWVATSDMICNDDFSGVTENCTKAVRHILGFQFKHLGINEKNNEKALESSELFSLLFGFDSDHTDILIFAGAGLEIMKRDFQETIGHIAVETNDVNRAIDYLVRKGFSPRYDTARKVKDKIKIIYLNNTYSGFAVYLIQK